MRRSSREIIGHQVRARFRQLDVSASPVEMIVAHDDQAGLLEARYPAQRRRTGKFGAVRDIADGVATLQHMGFKEMEEDVLGRTRTQFAEKPPSQMAKLAGTANIEPKVPSSGSLELDPRIRGPAAQFGVHIMQGFRELTRHRRKFLELAVPAR